jgi:DNA-binding IclR family transcriptional regulator
MKEIVHTRSHQTGRLPSLRDKILMYLEKQTTPKTAKEIADALGIHKSTPHRALKELTKMKLVDVSFDIDGAQYLLDKTYLEYFKMHPRRIKILSQ